LDLTVSVGTLYFPGDVATMFIMTTLNGQPTSVDDLQVMMIMPNGTSVLFNAVPVNGGLYKAKFVIPSNGPLGTYAVTAKAQKDDSGIVSAFALASFEVKQSWPQANGRNLATGTTIVGAVGTVGVLAVAWRRGYFAKRKQEFQSP
jgi:uncharacterized protein YfaS (alpha-2-macroglobulin family)